MNLKIFNLREMGRSFKKAFKRFPVVLSYFFVFLTYSLFLVHAQIDEKEAFYVLYLLFLGIILSTLIAISTEIKFKSKKIKFILHIGLIIILTGYYFLLSLNADRSYKYLYRMFIILFLSIIFVFVLPYFNKNKQINFWHYNFKNFINFTNSVFFAGVIYIGLTIALLVIDELFHVRIPSEIYFDILCFVSIIAAVNFFKNFPENYYSEEKIAYTKVGKILSQYILLPLTTLYFLILYAYLFRVVFMWEMPKGIISYLVLSFSALGILSLIAIFPIKDDKKNKWVNRYAKVFYWAVLPLVAFLFVAIYKRIFEYGITENRYLIVAFALWLAFIAIYSLITRQKDIKIIPISFIIVASLAFFGPWSAFNISKNSQMKLLDKLLVENNIIIDGKIRENTVKLADSVFDEIYDKINYLNKTHGAKIIAEKYNFSSDSLKNASVMQIIDSLRIDRNYFATKKMKPIVYFNLSFYQQTSNVKQYDYIVKLSSHNNDEYNNAEHFIKARLENHKLILSVDTAVSTMTTLEILEKTGYNYEEHDNYIDLDSAHAFIDFSTNLIDAKFMIESFSGEIDGKKISTEYIEGMFFIRLKKNNYL